MIVWRRLWRVGSGWVPICVVEIVSSYLGVPETAAYHFVVVVTHGWAMDSDLKNHFKRIKSRLTDGRKVLEKIYNDKDVQPYDVPDVKPEIDVFGRPPPHEGDS